MSSVATWLLRKTPEFRGD